MKNFDEFLARHNITILNNSKKCGVSNDSTAFFTNEKNYNEIITTNVASMEPLYTIEIPESRIKQLQQFEDQVFNNMHDRGHFNLFNTVMEQKMLENQLCEKFPAVKKAFENYSTILNMCSK